MLRRPFLNARSTQSIGRNGFQNLYGRTNIVERRIHVPSDGLSRSSTIYQRSIPAALESIFGVVEEKRAEREVGTGEELD